MINGHAFMYPKLKPTFWLNPWKLVSTNINGTIVHVYGEYLAYGVFANLSFFIHSKQFHNITNCEQQSGFIQRNTGENNPSIWYMNKVLTLNLGQWQLCWVIQIKKNFVMRIFLRENSKSNQLQETLQEDMSFQGIERCYKYFCIKLTTWWQQYKSE